MRHKYPTEAVVLARTPLGEANALVTLLTRDLGLVRARAQGVRRPGARLAASLTTFAKSEVTLVRGAEGWRVTGAQLSKHWFFELPRGARARAARITGFILRLIPAEASDREPFVIFEDMLTAFRSEPESLHEAIEYCALLRLLAVLGLDAGEIPTLAAVGADRSTLVARINRGIALSGL